MANFSYGVIAAVGVLVAVSIGFITMTPDEVIKDREPSAFALFNASDPAVTTGMPVPLGGTPEEPQDVMVSLPVGTAVPGCEADNMCYVPYEVSIPRGATVTWVVDDTSAHTITAGSASDGPSGLFDSGIVMSGATFSHTFEAAGTVDYFCVVHPWMVGVVVVS